MNIRGARSATAALLVTVVLLLGVAIAIHHNPLGSVDSGVLKWMIAHRTAGVTSVATVLTDMFSPVWVGVWAVVAAGVFLASDRTVARGAALLATVAVAGFVCEIIKLAVNRLRPPPIDQVASPEVAMSFPSGHVSGTAALAFGVAVIATVGSHPRRRLAAMVVAVAIAVVAAGTRLYLGAHWLSDVTAAIAMAGAVALVVPTLTARALTVIEPHTPTGWHHVLTPRTLTPAKG